ncbi:MAG TPA: chemotaxis protein CheW [Alphaproteobacteria bacterium]|nr:chemotaxis protein CheW [Alphaproteobacteria bacterium]
MPATAPTSKTARPQPGQGVRVLTFRLYNQVFALPVADVLQIIAPLPLTPVPQAPGFVEGVINLQGQVVPVVNLRKRFGLAPAIERSDERLIVATLGEQGSVALRVDTVRDVETIPAESIAPPPALVAGPQGAAYIKGISNHNNRLIIHVDPRAIFEAA